MLALFLCLLTGAAAKLYAQEAAAYKVEEVVNPRCDFSEVPQITDPPPSGRIFAVLDKHQSAKAAIIVYGQLPGTTRRYAQDVRRWMIESRGVTAERLVALYGGRSDQLRLELWLVPRGAALPALNPPEDYRSATLFDTYEYWEGESCASSHLPALRTFGEALKQRPGWQGFIVFRRHRNKAGIREGEEAWDMDGKVTYRQALRRAFKDKRFLAAKLGLAPARLKTLIVEDDRWTHAELWLVPPGAQAPQGR